MQRFPAGASKCQRIVCNELLLNLIISRFSCFGLSLRTSPGRARAGPRVVSRGTSTLHPGMPNKQRKTFTVGDHTAVYFLKKPVKKGKFKNAAPQERCGQSASTQLFNKAIIISSLGWLGLWFCFQISSSPSSPTAWIRCRTGWHTSPQSGMISFGVSAGFWFSAVATEQLQA